MRAVAFLAATAFSPTLLLSANAHAQGVTSGTANPNSPLSQPIANTLTTPTPPGPPVPNSGAASGAALRTGGGSGSGGDENIVVTGSSLASRRNAVQLAPVETITAKEISQTSAITLDDYLRRIPSLGTPQGNATTNGGDGLSCQNIRNLGFQRTLILIDGKRRVQSGAFGFSCVDLNQIPTDMVERIEILKDGGSALYGADAVAGVINIITKKNFKGLSVHADGSLTDVGDGKTANIGALGGFDFDQGRGNVTIGANYQTQGPIYQRDRPWAAQAQQSNTAGVPPTYGSPTTSGGRFYQVNDPDQNLYAVSQPGQAPHAYTSADNYNFAQDQQLQNYLQDSNIVGKARYEINEHFEAYVDANYNHRTAQQQLAPQPMTGSIPPNTLPNPLVIPGGYPYNPFPGEDVRLYRRLNEFGPRQTDQAADLYQITGGLRGTIVDNWKYDGSFGYGKTMTTLNGQGEVNYRNLLQELGIQQTDPSDAASPVVYNPNVCQASRGCQIQNIFGTGSLSPQGVQYARFTQHAHAEQQLRDFNLRVTNSSVARLPYKYGGPIGLSFGVEHRSEQGNYSPDPIIQSGDSLENSQSPTGGGFNATEVYAEMKLPLLVNAPFAKELTLDGQGRWSHYNTFGNTENWKLDLLWAPTRDIAFRGTLGTAFRQPNIYELFGGQSLSFESATDPCANAASYGALSGRVAARCAREGVSPNFQQSGSQIPTITGGNAQLRPETSRTYTIGTVITPRWVRNFQATVDYWHTSIANTISSLSTQYIVDQCYTGLNEAYCQYIGGRAGGADISSVTAVDQNLGVTKTNGIDFGLNYTYNIDFDNSITLQNQFQQLIGYISQSVADGPFINYAGRIDTFGYDAYPRVRDTASVTVRHRNLSVNYQMRYIGGMQAFDGSNDYVKGVDGQYQVPGIFYHDVSATYTLGRYVLTGGINNLLDKRPPFSFDGSTNTDPNIYDYAGRTIFARFAVRF
ncbi:TonB-dependent receptor domain-containing protein [Rhizosaccharibacter radicis]|uniref:TonB-dependent receptor n=1 Tax=Rhizosaccharibacter radicis TaxID=2782605 RepID=A0ABT1W095_9PROT|nr:TonB-dependent receptor [Acetobacteraceae bacterium KSS12]